ncbi:hypothetical protein [Cypionkella sp.]|uniref:hypothetical protein n=1 Tax=Cypionkella sp. TaxID=2811411 RepID=UPI003753385F
MATAEEILRSALAADKAGDTAAAAKLVAAARAMMAPQPAPQKFANDAGPMEPPRAPDGAVDGQLTTLATPAQPDRFGDTMAQATAAPIAAMGAFAGGLMDQSRSPTMQALPAGTPAYAKPMIAGLGDLGGLALSGLGTAYAGAAGLVGETFGGSPTNENKLARDLMMMGEVAVPELAGVSSTSLAAGRVAGAAAKMEAPVTARQAAARAASDLGVTPSLGMTGKGGAMAAAAMEKIPLSSSIIAKDAARVVGEVESAFTKAVAGVGTPKGAVGAGDQLQAGLGKYVEGFKARSAQMFDKVAQEMPPTTKVKIASTEKAVADAKQYFGDNPQLAAKLGLNAWDGVIGEAAQNGISWQALRQFRTKIGEAIGSNRGALADEDMGRLKSLYGAITEDMGVAAQSQGPAAAKAWREANGYYKSGATRIEKYLDKTISADSPERAFEAFTAMTKADRAGSDVQRMQQIKASLSRDDWNDVSASIVDRLGRANPGAQDASGTAFSPAKFLTEWNKISPEAKKILLPDEARGELQKLAVVADRVKAGNAERNMSNTGTPGAWLAILFGSSASPVTTGSALVANTLTAKALTSQTFLQAMNAAARGDTRAMRAMSSTSGAFAEDANTIMRLIAAESAVGPANTAERPLPLAK